MRILTVISGIVLLATGIWCFANRGTVFLNIAFVLGLVMLIIGAFSILVYFLSSTRQRGVGWYLTEGITTLILGLVVLGNLLVVDSMVPIFFGMWILFSGVTRLTVALNFALERNDAWIFNTIAGVISVICGIYAFFNQGMANPLPLMFMVGIIFMAKGVNILGYGVLMPSKRRMNNPCEEGCEVPQ